jgi:hypothetical protein
MSQRTSRILLFLGLPLGKIDRPALQDKLREIGAVRDEGSAS